MAESAPPWSMAGLPGKRASVLIGPPLFWSGPSSGLIGAAAVPIWLPLTPLISPVMPEPLPIRLYAAGRDQGAVHVAAAVVGDDRVGHGGRERQDARIRLDVQAAAGERRVAGHGRIGQRRGRRRRCCHNGKCATRSPPRRTIGQLRERAVGDRGLGAGVQGDRRRRGSSRSRLRNVQSTTVSPPPVLAGPAQSRMPPPSDEMA